MAYSVGTKLNVEEIELNEYGDKICVSPEDSAMFDNYIKCADLVMRLSKEKVAKAEEIEKKYGAADGEEMETETKIEMALELSELNLDFAVKATESIDSVFGEGTVRKYFRKHYEAIPSFLPGADCFMDFLEQMSPVMNDIFKGLAERREMASRERMAKYQPQDHKRKSK